MELSELEKNREVIQKEMLSIGEMLNGTLSTRFQKCGKKNCTCTKKGHPGHGPFYSLSYHDYHDKLTVKNFQPGQILEHVKQQIANYHRYKELQKQYVMVNTAICVEQNAQQKNQNTDDEVKKNSKMKSLPSLRRK